MNRSTRITIHKAVAGELGVTPSAQTWFAGGERVGYDPEARAIVRAQMRLSTCSRTQVPSTKKVLA
jgi:hypothetical protein